MRIFLYEHLTGGGLLPGDRSEIAPIDSASSLLREGGAMRQALADDLAAVPGVEVIVLHDFRLHDFHLYSADRHVTFASPRIVEVCSREEQHDAFLRLAGESDWSIVIAPECDGILLAYCQAALAAGARLLGPSPELVALASDKQATAETLAAAGVPTPRGIALARGERLPRDFSYPAVLKPRDGAGSQDIRLVHSEAGVAEVLWPARLEEYRPGIAASVAMIGGGTAPPAILEPCRQHLGRDGSFAYLGGSLPLPSPLAARARRLAERTAAALPPFVGYLGVDIVLGAAADGRDDVVIEINPRLTTSYVGLRTAAETNLAAAILEASSGCDPVTICFSREVLDEGVSFDSSGRVKRGTHALAGA